MTKKGLQQVYTILNRMAEGLDHIIEIGDHYTSEIYAETPTNLKIMYQGNHIDNWEKFEQDAISGHYPDKFQLYRSIKAKYVKADPGGTIPIKEWLYHTFGVRNNIPDVDINLDTGGAEFNPDGIPGPDPLGTKNVPKSKFM